MKKGDKKKLKVKAKTIEKIHEIIFLLGFLSVIAIIFIPSLRIYGAFYIVVIYLIDIIYGGCPLTVYENKALKNAGISFTHSMYIPRFFKKWGLNVSERF